MPDHAGHEIFQTALGLSITARCPIQCAHCIIEAGPHRKEEMAADRAVDWIRQAACYASGRIKTIIITGGEPFCSPRLLKIVLEANAALGFASVVVTNAFWAHTPATAERILRRYPQIDMLSISTDKYHQRFIPLAKARNAMRAAGKMNIPFNAAVCMESEEDLADTYAGLDGAVDAADLRPAVVLPAGRAKFLPEDAFRIAESAAAGGPCSGADFPIIFPDGRVLSCMGITEIPSGSHPLLSGNAHERPLAEILGNGARNAYLQAMRSLGRDFVMESIADTARGRIRIESYEKYGACSLCYALAHNPGMLEPVLDGVSRPETRKRIAAARMSRYGEKTGSVSTE